jgi:HK97 family phage major capsid protein
MNMTTPSQVQAAFADRANAVNELRSMADAAEGREFTAEEVASEARLNDAITAQDSAIDAGLKSLERDAKADEQRSQIEAFASAANVAPKEARSEFARMSEGEIRSYEGVMSPEVRDLLQSNTGANVVPTTLVDSLYVGLREGATVLQDGAAQVITTSAGGNLDLPYVGSRLVGVKTNEAATITEDDVTTPKLTLGAIAFKVMTQIGSETLQDEVVGIESFIGRELGESVARTFGAAAIVGTDLASGLAEATNTSAFSASAITSDQLIDVQHAIASTYRAGSAWVMNDSTVAAIRKLKDGNSQYLWQPGMTAGASSTLLGAPVLIDSGVASIGTSNVSVIYGNLQRGFVVRVVGSVRVERSDDYAFNADLVTFRAVLRADAGIRDENALVAGTHA